MSAESIEDGLCMISSPVTDSQNVEHVKTLNPKVIIRDYRKKYSVDVSKYYLDTKDGLKIFRCMDTGYRFYHPYSLAGDGAFYDAIVNDGGYYSNWKKEYDFAMQVVGLDSAKQVLDVGCGSGRFVSSVGKITKATGLELSVEAAKIGHEQGLDIKNEDLRAHSASNRSRYDVVCAFQVLEHVPNVQEFLGQMLDCLKPGGSLVISVPNCEPYICRNHWYGVSNLPPHHMGLWNIESLTKLTDYFPMEVISSDYDLPRSVVRYCVVSSISKVKHWLPNVRNENLLKAIGGFISLITLPYYLITSNESNSNERVMVHFRKTVDKA